MRRLEGIIKQGPLEKMNKLYWLVKYNGVTVILQWK